MNWKVLDRYTVFVLKRVYWIPKLLYWLLSKGREKESGKKAGFGGVKGLLGAPKI